MLPQEEVNRFFSLPFSFCSLSLAVVEGQASTPPYCNVECLSPEAELERCFFGEWSPDAWVFMDYDLDPKWCESLRDALSDWSTTQARDLPWRGEADPYKVWISEMMLVQTTVAAVVPYYHRFLARFPSVQSLAIAEEAAVLKAWEGLGYYRRARQLHAASKLVVERHGGRIPDDREALLMLPGIGRYIAGAILSFAFGQGEPILEANTERLLARLIGFEADVRTNRERLWQASKRVVPKANAGAFNQCHGPWRNDVPSEEAALPGVPRIRIV